MTGVIVCQLRGLSQESERHFELGMEIAGSLDHPPFDTSKMYWAGAIAAKERGDVDLTRRRCLALMEICKKSSVALWVPVAEALQGWAALEEGDRTGLERAKHGAAPVSRWAFQPYRDALLIEAYLSSEHWSEALECASKALEDTFSSGAIWYDAELHRLAGEAIIRAHRASGSRLFDRHHTSPSERRRKGERLNSPKQDVSESNGRDHLDRLLRSRDVRACGSSNCGPPAVA